MVSTSSKQRRHQLRGRSFTGRLLVIRSVGLAQPAHHIIGGRHIIRGDCHDQLIALDR